MTLCAICYTTLASREAAEKFASSAVEAGVAACVNIITGVTSVYLWEGAIQKEEECALVFKAPQECLERVAQWISDHHPYDTPAILCSTVQTTPAFAAYLSASAARAQEA